MGYFPTQADTAKRQQGILNRKTQALELAIHKAYEDQDGFNGIEGIKRIARDEPLEFFKLMMKRLPEVQGEGKGPSIQVHVYGKPKQVQAIDISAETAEEAKTVPEQQGGACPD